MATCRRACLSTEGVYCSRCVYYGKHQSFQATAGFRDYAPNAYSSSNGWSDRKSGSAGMPRPISYAVFCLKKKSGCSGFQYHMAFENQTSDADQVFEFDGLKVAVDQMSSMYLDGIEIDYIETIEVAFFF